MLKFDIASNERESRNLSRLSRSEDSVPVRAVDELVNKTKCLIFESILLAEAHELIQSFDALC